MIHISTIKSEIDNRSLVPVLQNVPKPQKSILNLIVPNLFQYHLFITKCMPSHLDNSFICYLAIPVFKEGFNNVILNRLI